MKTMSTGLFLSTLALRFFLGSLLVSVVNHVTTRSSHPGWLNNNLYKGRLDNFYWLVVIMSLVNFIIYLIFAKGYTYKDTVMAKHLNFWDSVNLDEKETRPPSK